MPRVRIGLFGLAPVDVAAPDCLVVIDLTKSRSRRLRLLHFFIRNAATKEERWDHAPVSGSVTHSTS